MSRRLSDDFASQSPPIRCEPVGGGSIAMVAAIGCTPGTVRVTGLKPRHRYLLAGAVDPCTRTDATGEAIVAVGPDRPVVVTLVPVI